MNRLVDAVGYEDDRLARLLVQADELVLQQFTGNCISAAEWLVHEHDARIAGDRPRESDSLLHAPRQLPDLALGECLQPYHAQVTTRLLPALGPGHVGEFHRRLDIGDDGAPGEKGEVLEDEGAVGARRPDGPAVHGHRSSCWFL